MELKEVAEFKLSQRPEENQRAITLAKNLKLELKFGRAKTPLVQCTPAHIVTLNGTM